jgi:hypothetical protein
MTNKEVSKGKLKSFLEANGGTLVGAMLTAVVGVLGVWYNVNSSATNNQLRRLELIEKQVQFSSSQQMAVNQMRADALNAMEKCIAPHLDGDALKIAALAAFHSSYGEFFDTRPVLEAFARTIEGDVARHELIRLAQRVARRQKNALLAAGGEVKRLEVKIAPGGAGEEHVSFHEHDLQLRFENVVCEGRPTDQVSVVFGQAPDIHESFALGYFDAPMMDNIAIPHADGTVHFVALNLLDIEPQQGSDGYIVVIDVVHFPEGVGTPTELRWKLLRGLPETADDSSTPAVEPNHVHQSG